MGLFDKAAATWLRGAEHTTSPAFRLDYDVSAGVDLLRAGEAKRGAQQLGDAISQGIAIGMARRLVVTLGTGVWQTGEKGMLDLVDALMAAAEPLGQTEAAAVWQCQRCYPLLLRGKVEEARALAAAALVDAQARLAAATPDQRDGRAMDFSAVRDLNDWFAVRDGQTLVARPARFNLTPGVAMAYATVVTRSKGALTLTSSVPWLTCRVNSAGLLYSTYVPTAMQGAKYSVLAILGPAPPAAGQGEVTLRWVDGEKSAELKLPVRLGAATQP